MFQVDWQKYEDKQEYTSEQFKNLPDAINCYMNKMSNGYFWVKLSHELMTHCNQDAESYTELEENWNENGEKESQDQALFKSFGIDHV